MLTEEAHHMFVGETGVGRIIQRALAGSRKKYTLELGGKAANIIFEDAAIDEAVEGIVNGIFFNQGHVCCAGSRILVHEGIADQVVGKLQTRMEKLRVGDPLDKAVDMGAIVAPVSTAPPSSLRASPSSGGWSSR